MITADNFKNVITTFDPERAARVCFELANQMLATQKTNILTQLAPLMKISSDPVWIIEQLNKL